MNGLAFKVLSLDDRALFESVFDREQPVISEYTFSNLFVWRNSRPIEYALGEGGLLLKIDHGQDESCFLPPIGFSDLKQAYQLITDWAQEQGKAKVDVFRIPESHIEVLQNSGWQTEENRDQYDYVYTAQALAELPGKRLDGKRGFVRKFNRENQYQYVPYEKKYRRPCLELAQMWMAERNPDDQALQAEYCAIWEYLAHYDKLSGCGSVFCIEDRVAAFCFGEELNRDTFVIHFEKADTRYQGIYQAVNQKFIQEEIQKRYKYVNREQDLGIPGIRKAKESYYPEFMVRKYWARFSVERRS